jgi:hypothetical protein
MAKVMGGHSGKLNAFFALALIVSSGQCVASCSFVSCRKMSDSDASSSRTNVSPCHRHRSAPAKSTQCLPDVVGEAAAPTADVSSNPANPVPLLVTPDPLQITTARSTVIDTVSVVPSPPSLAFLSSTVLRI